MTWNEEYHKGEKVDCLNGRARLGYLPYRQHIAVRYGEATRDMALAIAGYNGYENRLEELRKQVNKLAGIIADWKRESKSERMILTESP